MGHYGSIASSCLLLKPVAPIDKFLDEYPIASTRHDLPHFEKRLPSIFDVLIERTSGAQWACKLHLLDVSADASFRPSGDLPKMNSRK